ncbi:MAG: hypothetical protein IJ761_03460 [Bacteroidales bacterium]|nr:hypothetical protein [Bacteroidales bacterium]
MSTPYDDIINLPCPSPRFHTRMPRINRAAQFAPFSALTGYDDALTETARITDKERLLDEEELQQLDRKLSALKNYIPTKFDVKVLYFEDDNRKDGGSYRTLCGKLTQIDVEQYTLTFDNDKMVSIKRVVSIEADVFKQIMIDF